MRRSAKPVKAKVEAKLPVARKSVKDEGSRVHDLAKRLAEARGQLQTRDRELTEAQEQQTATAEILRVIASSPTDVRPVFDTIARNAMRLCQSAFSVVTRYDGELMHLAAHRHVTTEGVEFIQRIFPMRPTRATVSGRAVLEGSVVHVPDLLADPEYAHPLAEALQARGGLGVPMLRDGRPVGAIGLGRPEVGPFTDTQVALLKTFADQAVIAIENVRLFKELEVRNRDLTEALEQQTATGEILRVISSSPTDAQPVFDAIARNAMRLCDAAYSVIGRFDGQLLHLAAHAHVRKEGVEAVERRFPLRPTRAITSTRAILDRTVVHVPDVLKDPEYDRSVALAIQNRTTLAVPMLHDGEPIGSISVGRLEPRPFSGKQIELLRTFADQAVIAVENVRLFTELQEKNQALTKAHAQVTEALEQQTATSEILRAISTSPTELEPVFHTIVDSAVRLCGALFGSIFRVEDEQIHLVAHHGLSAEALREFQRTYPVPLRGGGVLMARAITEARIIHTVDVEQDETVPAASRRLARATGYRAALVVPLLREGRAVSYTHLRAHET